MKQKAIALLLCLCLALGFSGCGNGIQRTKGTLTVGVRSGVVNFGYFNELNQQYYGLDIDLAYALAKEMGYDVELVTTHAETRETDLAEGKMDMVIALYTITDARKELVDFTQPYFTDYSKIVVQASCGYHGLGDLKGKKIAVHAGTGETSQKEVAARMVEQHIFRTEEEAMRSLQFYPIERYGQMSYALEVGEVDAMIMDGCIASNYMNDDRIFLDDQVRIIEYGVATAKGNPLMQEIRPALQKLIEDGTVAAITEKWQGGERNEQTTEN